MIRRRDHRNLAISVLAALSLGACATYLPVETLARRAPACAPNAIARRTGDKTPTYFGCQVDTPIVTPKKRQLSYPQLFADANVEGVVELQFVVDERGAIDSSTIVVLRTTHDLFTRAARTSLLAWGAKPAVRRGRAVRQLTSHGFCFRFIRTPDVAPRCDDDLPRYGSADISRACESPRMTTHCTDGGCREEPQIPRFPRSRCP
jgi:hypothetical protein